MAQRRSFTPLRIRIMQGTDTRQGGLLVSCLLSFAIEQSVYRGLGRSNGRFQAYVHWCSGGGKKVPCNVVKPLQGGVRTCTLDSRMLQNNYCTKESSFYV